MKHDTENEPRKAKQGRKEKKEKKKNIPEYQQDVEDFATQQARGGYVSTMG